MAQHLLLALLLSTFANGRDYLADSHVWDIKALNSTEWNDNDGAKPISTNYKEGPYFQQRIAFPFTFDFYAPQRAVIIGTNGDLYFNIIDATAVKHKMVNKEKTLPSAEMMDIAGICTWNYLSQNQANLDISYQITSSSIWIKYKNLPDFWDTSTKFDFGAKLESDGGLTFAWKSVLDPNRLSAYGTNVSWFIGLRRPLNNDQGNDHKSDWKVTEKGTYLPRASVQSNRQAVFCPFTSLFCAYPKNLKKGGGSIYIALAGADVTCAIKHGFQFECKVTDAGATVVSLPGTLLVNMSILECPYDNTKFPAFTTATVDVVQVHTGLYTTKQTLPKDARSAMAVTFVADNAASAAGNKNKAEASFGQVVCTTCSITSQYCSKDCNGVARGSASLDNCTQCSGGNTGKVADFSRNCRGQCFGPAVTDASTCLCTLKSLSSPHRSMLERKQQGHPFRPLAAPSGSNCLSYAEAFPAVVNTHVGLAYAVEGALVYKIAISAAPILILVIYVAVCGRSKCRRNHDENFIVPLVEVTSTPRVAPSEQPATEQDEPDNRTVLIPSRPAQGSSRGTGSRAASSRTNNGPRGAGTATSPQGVPSRSTQSLPNATEEYEVDEDQNFIPR
mmetsp:Transcript_49708/g.97465  ORF Transcript_49708/g.97465 Transcript_49708/m.97465 type:complete len:617 (-) Transcript_49708:41-1891(-)